MKYLIKESQIKKLYGIILIPRTMILLKMKTRFSFLMMMVILIGTILFMMDDCWLQMT